MQNGSENGPPHPTPDTPRYEGASTFFGPNTLLGFIQELSRLAKDIATGAKTKTGPPPRIDLKKELSLMPGPKLDRCPKGSKSTTSCFGEILRGQNPKRTQYFGTKLQVKFRGANPRHNLRLGGTYMTLERVLSSDGGVDETEVVMTDSDYSTNFEYKREFGTNFWDGLFPKNDEGCEKDFLIRQLAALRDITKRIFKSAKTVVTQGMTNSDISNGLFMRLVNISHAIKATNDQSANDVLCFGGLWMCVRQGNALLTNSTIVRI